MRDVVYYYGKNNYAQYELGEIQSNFEQAYSIDGSKDSAKIIVFGFVEHAIEPNTLISHPTTHSLWIVSHDQVERYINEVGFIYKHILTLEGAIELLNVRDLTDCGYYQNKYTTEDFIERLFKLSTFEFAHDDRLSYEITWVGLAQTKIVDFVKTFENYTLLSALREFLSGYNCCPKIRYFEVEQNSGKWGDNLYHLCHIEIVIEPKSGFGQLISSNSFNEVQEKRNFDKNSFSISSVSNAENVVSTISKTFPTIGGVQLTGTTDTITATTGRIRLPSNIFKVNWLRMLYKIKYHITLSTIRVGIGTKTIYNADLYFIPQNDDYNEREWQKIIEELNNAGGYLEADKEVMRRKLAAYKETIFNQLPKAGSMTLYNTDRYNPYNSNLVAPDEPREFYFPRITKQRLGDITYNNGVLALVPNSLKEVLKTPLSNFGTIGWERGKNYIENFGFLSPADDNLDLTYITNFNSTDLRKNTSAISINETSVVSSSMSMTFIYITNATDNVLRINNVAFSVNYIPMGDIKIKYDNEGVGLDSSLYNQNGKLNDSNGLSKMILSHTKEIESENITKYGVYYNFDTVPQVGDIYEEDDNSYVINNVSLTFSQNESENDSEVGYYISCEFSLSRFMATKSLLTNPNTNIRDYGIPQNYNVKRKQLYRDFYELDYTISDDTDSDPYLALDRVLNLSSSYKQLNEHIAVIKVVYDSAFGGDESHSIDPQDTWYYQLETTTYILKKSIYEVVDFKDNNIIGYSSLNTSSAITPQKWLSGINTMANTPVSYVDDSGELKSVYLAFTTAEQLTSAYQGYIQEHSLDPNRTLYNSSVFIDGQIYEGGDLIDVIEDSDTVNMSLTTEPANPTQIRIYDLVSEGLLPSGIDFDPDDLQLVVNYWEVNQEEVTANDYLFFKDTNGKYHLEIFDTTTNLGDKPTYIEFFIRYPMQRPSFIGAKDNCDFIIEEVNYNKDAVEVPVFEYSCQIDDTKNIVVGDEILNTQTDDIAYFYKYFLVPKGTIPNENLVSGTLTFPSVEPLNMVDNQYTQYQMENACKFVISGNDILISLYRDELISVDDVDNPTYGLKVLLTSRQIKHNDIVIVRNKVKLGQRVIPNPLPTDPAYIIETENQLIFIIKNLKSSYITSSGDIDLKINYYKAK